MQDKVKNKRYFSIPYNNDLNLLDDMHDEFGNLDECKEIYFAIPLKYSNTGRALEQTEEYEKQIIVLLKKCDSYQVEGNMLLNSACLETKMQDYSFVEKCVEYIKNLHDVYGLISITVSDFLLACYIKEKFPAIKIECSSVAYVDSVQKAKMWDDIGIDMLVIPPDYNKNLLFISSIKKALKRAELKLLVNQDCIPSCPMRQFHNTIQSHGNDGAMYLETCSRYMKEHPWVFYSSTYIPPKYLHYYDDYISLYKIVDRKKSTEKIIKAYGSYTDKDSYREKANEWNARIPEEVFEKVIRCNRYCEECGFCKAKYESNKQGLRHYIGDL